MLRFWILSPEDFDMQKIPNWIVEKAQRLGIDCKRKNKFEVIRDIQTKEGYKPCYGDNPFALCPYKQCCWKRDCKGLVG